MDATLMPGPAGLTEYARADQPSVAPDGHIPSLKEFATARAEFALRGHALIASGRSADGKDTWVVGRWGYSRSFDCWPTVLEFLEQIGGQP